MRDSRAAEIRQKPPPPNLFDCLIVKVRSNRPGSFEGPISGCIHGPGGLYFAQGRVRCFFVAGFVRIRCDPVEGIRILTNPATLHTHHSPYSWPIVIQEFLVAGGMRTPGFWSASTVGLARTGQVWQSWAISRRQSNGAIGNGLGGQIQAARDATEATGAIACGSSFQNRGFD